MLPDYRTRLSLMEDWYKELVASEDRELMLLEDYAPHRAFLGSLTGRVIDIGGGAGIAARFLRPEVDYVVVDPSEVWESPEWVDFGRSFRAGGPEPEFVKAPGETLPFADSQFDAALSFWSLNHVSDPARCVAEMARVLKPGAPARIVLEDTVPSWGDLIAETLDRLRWRISRRDFNARVSLPMAEALKRKLGRTWPIQEDHVPIPESSLLRWLRGRFKIVHRQWLGRFLTYDLAKKSRS